VATVVESKLIVKQALINAPELNNDLPVRVLRSEYLERQANLRELVRNRPLQINTRNKAHPRRREETHYLLALIYVFCTFVWSLA
jgi:hypothetical protein